MLLKVELARLTNNFAKNFEANGIRGHDKPAAVTTWAILGKNVLQTFACTLARHLHQTQW